MNIEVDHVELAVSRIAASAAQAGGYVIETRTELGEGGPREATLGSLPSPPPSSSPAWTEFASSPSTVETESATGVDVSQEYVDLESELANLEATKARVRGFLDNAKSVEEALQVNAELSRLEGEIGKRKGRLQFLTQRTAFSTITVTVRRAPGQETPTPIPSPTPIPALDPWHPSGTVAVATRALQEILRRMVELAIWFVIVWLPVLAILSAVVWAARRVRGRWLPPAAKRKEPPAARD